jgi:hypothetical protein
MARKFQPVVPYERGATDTDRAKACILLKQVCTALMPVGRGTPKQCCARFFPEYNAIPFHVLVERDTRPDTRRTPRRYSYRFCYIHNRSRCGLFSYLRRNVWTRISHYLFISKIFGSGFGAPTRHHGTDQDCGCEEVLRFRPRQRHHLLRSANSEGVILLGFIWRVNRSRKGMPQPNETRSMKSGSDARLRRC